jgi:hypothetical protein
MEMPSVPPCSVFHGIIFLSENGNPSSTYWYIGIEYLFHILVYSMHFYFTYTAFPNILMYIHSWVEDH